MPSKIIEAPQEVQALYQQALLAQRNSYSPYSQCKVGAAVLLDNGAMYSGCNVENSSYGATVCAERAAILKAVSEQGAIRIRIILVITDATPPWPPCGICRQVMAEFGEDCEVHSANTQGDWVATHLRAMLPEAFSANSFRALGQK